MKEILFRAKRVDTGEWVVGSLIQTSYFRSIRSWISSEQEDKARLREISSNQAVWRALEVRTDTICQYTGLKDKNGKLIWENDVVRFKHEKFDLDDGLEPWERSCLPNKKEYTRNYAVEFCNTSTHYGLRFRNKSIWFMVHRMTVVMHDVEVIGNIFDGGSENIGK